MLGFFITATLLSVTTPALTQNTTTAGILGWFDLNTFHPTSNPNDGFFLERGKTLKNLQPAMGGVIQIDNDPLTWQKKNDGAYNETAKEVNQLMVLHLNAALGLFGYTQVGVQFPLYLDRGTGSRRPGGIGDLRIVPKLAHRFETMGLGILMPISLPTGNEAKFAGQGQITVKPRLAADWGFGRFGLITNVGVLIVGEQKHYDLTTGPKLILGMGADLNLSKDSDAFRLLCEVQISSPFSNFLGRSSTPADMLLGVVYTFKSQVSLKGAMGTGLSPGVGAPDFRLIAGLGFVPIVDNNKSQRLKILDSDNDGIVDANDICPEEAEDFDNYNDDDGCLDADNDNDSIPDSLDECPSIPEDHDNFNDADGCPDNDNDADLILDDSDKCPSLPESQADNALIDGCPDSFNVKKDALIFDTEIRFVSGEANISDKSSAILEDIAAAVNANPSWKGINIVVHTKNSEDPAHSQRLSEKRALNLLKAFATLGVDLDRLVAEGRSDTSERVEITIVRGDAK